jgi:hypothetical protein
MCNKYSIRIIAHLHVYQAHSRIKKKEKINKGRGRRLGTRDERRKKLTEENLSGFGVSVSSFYSRLQIDGCTLARSTITCDIKGINGTFFVLFHPKPPSGFPPRCYRELAIVSVSLYSTLRLLPYFSILRLVPETYFHSFRISFFFIFLGLLCLFFPPFC